MASWLDELPGRIGTAVSPYGFAPPQPGMVQGNPAAGAGMQFLGDMGMQMLANGRENPAVALGQAYGKARESARDRSKDAAVMKSMLEQAEQEKQKRHQERERKLQMEQAISQLPPEQQAMARMFPEKFFGEQIEQQFAPPGGGGTEAGLNLVYWKDKDNKLHAGQLLKSGGMQEVPPPNGGDWAPALSMQNLGTSVAGVNTRTGEQVTSMPIDNRGKASQTEQGQVEGQAIAGAPGDIAAADLALDKINELRSDPNRTIGTGKSAIFNSIPASPGYDFQTKVDEVTSGAFLTAIQQMRGLGQLSNAEGQTAKAAVTRMNTATSEEEFMDALNDYEEIVMQGRQRAAQRLNGGQAPAESTGNTRYKFNPETGELE